MIHTLSGGDYGGYEVVKGLLYLGGELQDVSVILSETEFTVDGWVYRIADEDTAVFVERLA
jgi:hypothetical protein